MEYAPTAALNAPVATERSPIDLRLVQLDTAVQAIHERLDWLGEQLSPVLCVEEKCRPLRPTETSAPAPDASVVAQRLYSLLGSAENAIDRIDALRSRLEV